MLIMPRGLCHPLRGHDTFRLRDAPQLESWSSAARPHPCPLQHQHRHQYFHLRRPGVMTDMDFALVRAQGLAWRMLSIMSSIWRAAFRQSFLLCMTGTVARRLSNSSKGDFLKSFAVMVDIPVPKPSSMMPLLRLFPCSTTSFLNIYSS